MFGIAPFNPASERPCFQNIGMQITAEIGGGQKGLPNCDESDQQKRNGPTRFDSVSPIPEQPPPTCRGVVRARGHCRKCKIDGHCYALLKGKRSAVPWLNYLLNRAN